MVSRSLINVDFDKTIAKIDRNIYGLMVEHDGTCVYGGMYVGKGNNIPEIRGWRKDALGLVKDLRPSIIRWPGGCFTEYYHWEDGIGPVKDRPLRIQWFWEQPDPNHVGIHEFIDYCQMVGAEPYPVINVRTGTVEEAARWVEYCNGSLDTKEGKRRAQNGHPEPFNVKYWNIGNESWDLGAEYLAKWTVECAKAIREVDSDVKLVAIGFHPEWNSTMLSIAGKYVDYIAPHHYDGVRPDEDDREGSYYANVASSERMLNTCKNTADLIKKFIPDNPEFGVSIDEWGVWYDIVYPGNRQAYNLSDGLLTAGFLSGLQKLCAKRKGWIATWAQMANHLGLYLTYREHAWGTPCYYAFKLYSSLCGDQVVECNVDCETFNAPAKIHGPIGNTVEYRPTNVEAHIPGPRRVPKDPINNIPFLDISATKERDNKHFILAVINRLFKEDITSDLNLIGLPSGLKTKIYMLNGPDVFATNTYKNKDNVSIVERTYNGVYKSYTFPAHSVTVLSFE